jgi:hypothetical protein
MSPFGAKADIERTRREEDNQQEEDDQAIIRQPDE